MPAPADPQKYKEWKEKIIRNNAQTGKPAWNRGLKMSDKVREKMSFAKLGKPNPRKGKKTGKPGWLKGKRLPFTIWNKGKHVQTNNSLKEWRENGGRVWNKGLKGFKAKENHYNWKGGITTLEHQIRTCYEYRQWRSDVFTRDKFICIKCGWEKGHILEAHHIVKFSDIMKKNNIKTFQEAINCQEFWNINNGITVCKECHNKLHK